MRAMIYQQWGLAVDPWPTHQDTADARRIRLLVSAAVAGGAMVCIHGPRGSGKTHALWAALGEADCQVVEPLRLDRERMLISDVLSAVVEQLSDERARHSAEARAGQARRILRAAKRPVLVIDEAHGLHGHTVRALKRLRELGARGQRRALLPVILVGRRIRRRGWRRSGCVPIPWHWPGWPAMRRRWRLRPFSADGLRGRRCRC